MMDTVDPEDAEDGYYWSTGLEEVIKVRTATSGPLPPTKVVDTADNQPGFGVEYLDGELIPLNLPPKVPINYEEVRWLRNKEDGNLVLGIPDGRGKVWVTQSPFDASWDAGEWEDVGPVTGPVAEEGDE